MTPPVVPDIMFTEPETITVAELEEGDFVIEVPTQDGVRGVRVNSGVRALTPDYGTWRHGPPRRRVPEKSTIIRFLDPGLAGLNVPDAFRVQVRRREGRLTLDAQVARLQRDYDAACADTAADQGEAVVDTGGWHDLAVAVAGLPGPEISPAARREFLRRNGITPRR